LGLVVSAVVVLIGTSYPIIAELLGRPKVAVEQRFYNLLHVPIGAWILLLNGLSLLFQWRATPGRLFWQRLWIPLAISVVGAAMLWGAGIQDGALVGLGATAWFVLAVNGRILLQRFRQRPQTIGIWLAHAGIALLVLGTVCVGTLSWTVHARLPQNEPVRVGAYQLTYLGRERIEQQYTDREKWRYAVRVEYDGREATVFPVLFWSDYNQRQAAFLEPGVRWRLMADLYMAPKAVETENGAVQFLLRRGEDTVLPGDAYRVRLLRFETGQARADTLTLAVWVELRSMDGATDTLRLPAQMLTLEHFLPQWHLYRDSLEVALLRIIPERLDIARSQAVLGVRQRGVREREVFTVEFSLKPGINLVWLGSLLTAVGLFWMGLQRLRRTARGSIRDGQSPVVQSPTAARAE
ncbi:MAG: hypothetical protein NZ949_04195, partial [Candidatus Kapabacteria bacterium]|nr:hypothetical protein [Candidatus Kapabacteria bacterium]MDW7996281.1 cytochrome c-type biogenesis CcmF C-terminal domain-containing protein [Bacteroidota bacterium]